MKECTVCKKSKRISDYYIKNKSKGWIHSQCKSCYKDKRATFMQEHYKKYGDAYRERARIRKTRVKKLRQDQLFAYMKGRSCEFCGFDDLRALDFDHIDANTKKFGIARAINDGYAWEEIFAEISKCRVLCSNCHRIRTAEQHNWRRGRAVDF